MCKKNRPLSNANIERQLKKNGLSPLCNHDLQKVEKPDIHKTITSTEIGSVSKFTGEKTALELVAKAGFDAWDFSMFRNIAIYDHKKKDFLPASHPLAGNDYIKYVRELRRIGEDNGIFCNQSHAPFPRISNQTYEILERALECTAEAGGKICVIHPCQYCNVEQNAEFYNKLLPFAKSCGVKIAAENMWDWDAENNHAVPAPCSNPQSFLELLNAVSDDYLVACLDIGHSELKGLNTSAVDMIYTLKDKLQALHIHDNDKIHDLHQIPFSKDIEFDPIVKALYEIGYSGEFTLESNAFIKRRTLVSNLMQMGIVARTLANKFEECKK